MYFMQVACFVHDFENFVPGPPDRQHMWALAGQDTVR
jgi:hypothetical protein